MRKNKVTQKDVLFLSISMFAIIACWIGFSLYHSWTTSTVSEDLQLQIVPIAPNFDTQTLNKLKSREKIEPVSGAITQVTPTPTVPVVIEPEASPTEEIILTEELLPTEELFPTEEPTPAL